MSDAPASSTGEGEERLRALLRRLRRQGFESLSRYLSEHPDDEFGLVEDFLRVAEAHASTHVSPDTAPAEADQPHVGRYRVVREIGRGGQGVVYLAEDTLLHRRVALKVLSKLAAMSADVVARLKREALVTSKLDHPAICPVYDSGFEGEAPFIAMRFVEGQTLAEKLARARGTSAGAGRAVPVAGPTSMATASRPAAAGHAPASWIEIAVVLELFEKLARGLHVAHELGVVHRDVKPGNIMITADGAPVLLDFGLAAVLDSDEESITRTGELFGTPLYMAPEQLIGQLVQVDRRADVYALAVSLYECLTLTHPFTAPTRQGVYQAIQTRTPPRARHYNTAVTSDLELVLEVAMDKDRDRRYATAQDFAEDLRRVRQHEPIRARPIPQALRLKRWAQRHPTLAVALVSAFVLLAGGLAVSLTLLRAVRHELRTRRGLELAHQAAAEVARSPRASLRHALAAVETDRRPETVSQLFASIAADHEVARVATEWPTPRLLRVSPDGTKAVIAGPDARPLLWDLRQPGVRPITLRGHTKEVSAAAFLSAGLVVTAGADGLLFWDGEGSLRRSVATGEPVSHVAVRPGAAPDLAIGFATGVGLLSPKDTEVRRLPDHHAPTACVEWSAAGDRLLIGGGDGWVVVTDPGGGELFRRRAGDGAVLGTFAPTGGEIATWRHPPSVHEGPSSRPRYTVREWDLATGRDRQRFHHPNHISTVSYSADGASVLTGSHDGTAVLWDRDDGRILAVYPAGGSVERARLAADESTVLLVTRGALHLFQRDYTRLATFRGHANPVVDAAFAGTPTRVVSIAEDRTARLWSLDTTHRRALLGHRHSVYGVAVHGDRIASCSADGRLLVHGPGGAVACEGFAGAVYACRFAPDGSAVFGAGVGGSLRAHDSATAELRWRGTHSSADLGALAVSGNGAVVAAGGRDGVVHLYDAHSGADAGGPLVTDAGDVHGVDLSEDAGTVVTAGDDGNLKVWRRDGSSLGTMPHPAAVRSVQLRGDRILTACDDGFVREWTVAGELVREFSAHQGKAYCARWSPDGRSLLTVGRTVRWWTGDGTPIACIVDGAASWWAEPTADRRAVVAADDGSVRVLDLDVDAILRAAADVGAGAER